MSDVCSTENATEAGCALHHFCFDAPGVPIYRTAAQADGVCLSEAVGWTLWSLALVCFLLTPVVLFFWQWRRVGRRREAAASATVDPRGRAKVVEERGEFLRWILGRVEGSIGGEKSEDIRSDETIGDDSKDDLLGDAKWKDELKRGERARCDDSFGVVRSFQRACGAVPAANIHSFYAEPNLSASDTEGESSDLSAGGKVEMDGKSDEDTTDRVPSHPLAGLAFVAESTLAGEFLSFAKFFDGGTYLTVADFRRGGDAFNYVLFSFCCAIMILVFLSIMVQLIALYFMVALVLLQCTFSYWFSRRALREVAASREVEVAILLDSPVLSPGGRVNGTARVFVQDEGQQVSEDLTVRVSATGYAQWEEGNGSDAETITVEEEHGPPGTTLLARGQVLKQGENEIPFSLDMPEMPGEAPESDDRDSVSRKFSYYPCQFAFDGGQTSVDRASFSYSVDLRLKLANSNAPKDYSRDLMFLPLCSPDSKKLVPDPPELETASMMSVPVDVKPNKSVFTDIESSQLTQPGGWARVKGTLELHTPGPKKGLKKAFKGKSKGLKKVPVTALRLDAFQQFGPARRFMSRATWGALAKTHWRVFVDGSKVFSGDGSTAGHIVRLEEPLLAPASAEVVVTFRIPDNWSPTFSGDGLGLETRFRLQALTGVTEGKVAVESPEVLLYLEPRSACVDAEKWLLEHASAASRRAGVLEAEVPLEDSGSDVGDDENGGTSHSATEHVVVRVNSGDGTSDDESSAGGASGGQAPPSYETSHESSSADDASDTSS
jgi:membrane protein implicated in regulation of membrane protease activity